MPCTKPPTPSTPKRNTRKLQSRITRRLLPKSKKELTYPVPICSIMTHCYSLARDAKNAFNSLDRLASEPAFRDADHLMSDPDFDFVRKDKRWADIVARVQKTNPPSSINSK